MYKLTQYDAVIRKSDNACIPFAEGNSDYQKYLAWIAEGNTPEPAFTPEELAAQAKAQLTNAVQQHLDAGAQAKGYDSIVSACSYAAAPNAFQAESQAFLTWRAACWQKCYQLMAEVQAQTRPVPTEAELLAELPELVLPWAS